MRRAGAGPEQAEVIVDLGDRADGRPGIGPRGLLLDGNRRRESFDRVDVGLVHEPEELPRISGERFDVAALSLGVDRVEGERRLPRAGKTREYHEGVPRQFDVDVLEIMLACSADD